MKEVENLLISQAYALNSIFCDSLYKAMGMTPQYVPNLKSVNEIYAKIGLKAQAQCRATLETLATIKNPPHLAFIRQQYVAYQQQVNNQEGIPTQPGNNIGVAQDNRELRARGKVKISKNELLETSNNVTRLDTRKTKKTSKINKEVETVE